MARERKGSKEQIERRLIQADEYWEKGKSARALGALRTAWEYLKSYDGPGKEEYLKHIKDSAATIVREDRTLEDYNFDRAEALEHFVNQARKNPSPLEGEMIPVIIGAGGLIAGLFFLSSNITGKVIGNLTNSTSNIIGAVLLVVGLVGGFFWFNERKK